MENITNLEEAKKKLKWAFIEPLTGGFYLGAEAAIGHPAEWILSFPGLCNHVNNADGSIKSAANEYHLCTYLKKHNRLPPYYAINREMFAEFKDDPNAFNPEFIKTDFSPAEESFKPSAVDIVCALPVCSGLSNATTTHNEETRDARNQNMQWITEYVLMVIAPKAYIFENAPALFAGAKGKPIREYINKVAGEKGYSVSYFKTDTKLHHNAQRRPRTFVICWKKTKDGEQMPPVINFVKDEISVKKFFEETPKYDQTEQIPLGYSNQAALDYMKSAHPNDYRELMKENTSYAHIVKNDEVDAFIKFCETYKFDDDPSTKHRETTIRQIKHAKEKYASGSWIFDTTTAVIDDTKKIPTIMHKVTVAKLHPYEDRLLNVGEILYCMGMPTDYHIYGQMFEKTHQTGQNVPVKTAQYIVSEIVRVLSDWDNLRNQTNGNPFFGDDDSVEYVDNIKQTYSTKPE